MISFLMRSQMGKRVVSAEIAAPNDYLSALLCLICMTAGPTWRSKPSYRVRGVGTYRDRERRRQWRA